MSYSNVKELKLKDIEVGDFYLESGHLNVVTGVSGRRVAYGACHSARVVPYNQLEGIFLKEGNNGELILLCNKNLLKNMKNLKGFDFSDYPKA